MKILPYFCFIIKHWVMNEKTKDKIKVLVTGLFKEYLAKQIDEKLLIDNLYKIHNTHRTGDLGLWYRWHDGHTAAITIGDIKRDLTGAHMRNKVYMCECMEATVNDNSLVVNFS